MRVRSMVQSRSPAKPERLKIPIRSEADIVAARQRGRELALMLGFQATDQTLIATAISELARNILRYAKKGEILLEPARAKETGITIEARDEGPGISDIDRAIQAGFSTSGGLGLGLPGVKHLMDEFEITSEVGRGTRVKATKWKR